MPRQITTNLASFTKKPFMVSRMLELPSMAIPRSMSEDRGSIDRNSTQNNVSEISERMNVSNVSLAAADMGRICPPR